MELQNLTITRPGLITGRDAKTHLSEKISYLIFCIPRISCENLVKAIIDNSLESTEKCESLSNTQLCRLARKSKLS
ncbi:unnamed protein product [Moneuplotes crassus]|uniref:Uncharacterized protein n=1 Tax=Euplotes crassus TaxID=5936 RepID=A0AAD2D4K9_EUPCR|nr:unnamed protein product [Moneuplotes crassus]